MFGWMHDAVLGVVHLRIVGWLPLLLTCAAALALVVAIVIRRRLIVGVVAVLLVVVAAAAQVNAHAIGYPTLAAVLGHPPVVAADLGDIETPADDVVSGAPLDHEWSPPVAMPPVGDVIEADIPGTVSGFHARPASIYVPPAYLSEPRAQLPVLVLLTGQPGHVIDWIQGGHVVDTMNRFASTHDGLAPVVVVADALGEFEANPMCMDSNLGHVFTYLSVDVPQWLHQNLQVSTDTADWAIGGYSYGGTCALQTAVGAPEVYPTFLDISGEDEQRTGTHAESVTAAFGDDSPESEGRFDAATPLSVMQRTALPDSAGAFVVGSDDTEFRPQTRRAYDVAAASGLDAHYRELPGGHSMDVWAPALELELGWLAARMRIVD